MDFAEGEPAMLAKLSKCLDVSPEEESELLEAIAEAERGETVRAADLLERLRR